MLSKPKNANYAAIVVVIEKLIPLENCDFVQAAIILGNQVIVSKKAQVGDIGLFFPLECQLSADFLKHNNLYRKETLNVDPKQKGYFEENGRVRSVKFRSLHKSEGLFMPLTSVAFTNYDITTLKVNDEFDSLNGINVCKKYVIKEKFNNPSSGTSGKSRKRRVNISEQFKFHKDTSQLYKNIHLFKPDQIISVTYKMHGTSGISSYVLWDRDLNMIERLLKRLGIRISDKEYKSIYASRSVIKNLEESNKVGFYKVDIWGYAHEAVKHALKPGMTLYYEIVGYLPNGALIQGDFDYGYKRPEKVNDNVQYTVGINFGVHVYRITCAVEDNIIEYSTKQIQSYCAKYGLSYVPELFYGNTSELSDERMTLKNWQSKLLQTLKDRYNEKDCFMCKNVVPEEGCVVRIEDHDFNVFKLKSNRFYDYETKSKDKDVVDIEENN